MPANSTRNDVRYARDVIGPPPGRYDGVQTIRTNSPFEKGYRLSWTGRRGEIAVRPDDNGRVAQASFYPGDVLQWSAGDYVWERFIRVKHARLPLPSHIALHFFLSSLTTTLLGAIVIQCHAHNLLALHGFIGLPDGLVASIAILYDGYFWDIPLTAFTLEGPILGAVAGIATTLVRRVITGQFRHKRTTKPHKALAASD